MFEVNVKNVTEEGIEGKEGRGPAQVWGSAGMALCEEKKCMEHSTGGPKGPLKPSTRSIMGE